MCIGFNCCWLEFSSNSMHVIPLTSKRRHLDITQRGVPRAGSNAVRGVPVASLADGACPAMMRAGWTSSHRRRSPRWSTTTLASAMAAARCRWRLRSTRRRLSALLHTDCLTAVGPARERRHTPPPRRRRPPGQRSSATDGRAVYWRRQPRRWRRRHRERGQRWGYGQKSDERAATSTKSTARTTSNSLACPPKWTPLTAKDGASQAAATRAPTGPQSFLDNSGAIGGPDQCRRPPPSLGAHAAGKGPWLAQGGQGGGRPRPPLPRARHHHPTSTAPSTPAADGRDGGRRSRRPTGRLRRATQAPNPAPRRR